MKMIKRYAEIFCYNHNSPYRPKAEIIHVKGDPSKFKIPPRMKNDCFAFRFFDREESAYGVGLTQNYSKLHIVGKQMTIEAARKEFPKSALLVLLQKNHCPNVIMTANNNIQPVKDSLENLVAEHNTALAENGRLVFS
jgi:hypothetical protein